jgi:UDP-N-acetylmuramate--alanine ligase
MSKRMRIGIFFGGNSREREVSFAGGRTVYDNLDKSLFEAVPIFVDSFNQFVLLDWKYIYKGSIRDFYPPVETLRQHPSAFQVYAENITDNANNEALEMAKKIGKPIEAKQLKQLIDLAFLALHGNYGEDGTIQGLLEWHQIPYTGSGIMPSALGMNKRIQKTLMEAAGMAVPQYDSFYKEDLAQLPSIHQRILKTVGIPFIVKPANQGSSVGVSAIDTKDFESFENACHKALFMLQINKKEWIKFSPSEKFSFIQKLTDIKEGIGLPLICEQKIIRHPDQLMTTLNLIFKKQERVFLESLQSETEVLIESFIEGREFSCIVIKNEKGEAISLPPTEIIKGKEVFDYRSKYLPGLSRKVTPIETTDKQIQAIREACQKLFTLFNFHVYARIDGFLGDDGKLYLNDPNTTSGMMPSSFFFHQAAEIGLNPSQFLSFIIRSSLAERMNSLSIHFNERNLMIELDKNLVLMSAKKSKKIRVAVMMGGYSSERHISVESGRNIFEKLSSSEKYAPFPVFVSGNEQSHQLYLLPFHVMLKDNADDILEKVKHYKRPAIMNKIAENCADIIAKYTSSQIHEPREISYKELKNIADTVFIALHGRPGEDGTIQKELIKVKLPFNGSGVESSQLTINKYNTNQLLKEKGFLVAEQVLVYENDWKKSSTKYINAIEKMGYPLIAKPADDGCSSAVKKIKNRKQLLAFAEATFRESIAVIPDNCIKELNIQPKEEFPIKPHFLVEKFIEKGKAQHFLEITGGLMTHYKAGKLLYETFEPSETLAEGEILSLEEKFLAGQGQNITPARYDSNPSKSSKISKEVQKVLKAVAKTLQVEGYCRIDAFVKIYKNNKIEVFIIEINSLPGMTPATAIFHQCAINGYKPYEFIDGILQFGAERLKLNK